MLQQAAKPFGMTTQPSYDEGCSAIEDDGPMQPAERLMSAIVHGEPVLAVLGTNAAAVLAVVDDCVRLLSDQPIRIARFRGSQGSPLTLPHIVKELGAIERGGFPADDDELIVRMLTKPNRRQGRMLLIFEQAELLPLRTLSFLQIISTVFGTATPGLQLLFIGSLDFKDIIERDELAGLYGRLATIIQVANGPTDVASGMSPLRRPSVSKWQDYTSKVNNKKTMIALLLGLIVLISGVTFASFQLRFSGPARDGEGDVAEASLPRPGQPMVGALAQSSQPFNLPLQTAAPPSRSTLPSQSADRDREPATTAQPTKRRNWPVGEQLTRLQEEFERFLAQTEWGAKRQSDAERSRLFSEFLQWNYGAAGSRPETTPSIATGPVLSHARVTLHFLASSNSGKGMATEIATALHSMVGLARTRPVADVPKTYELRYFAQEDEGLAAMLAQMLQAPEATWTTRIMPSYRPLPLPHTIELWIPLR